MPNLVVFCVLILGHLYQQNCPNLALFVCPFIGNGSSVFFIFSMKLELQIKESGED